MSIKKILSSLLTFIIILTIGIGGYIFINQQTKKRLTELERETQIVEKLALPSSKSIVLPNRPKAEKTSSFYLKANRDSLAINEYFNVSVIVKAQEKIVDGVEFLLKYDPKMVDIGEPMQGAFFSLYPQKEIDPEKGTIRVIALQPSNKDKKLNEETVVTLPVTARKRGTVNFEFIKEKTHIAAYGGQDLLREVKGLEIEIK